ncbi:MAG TPA: type II toxin-antitoxin system VapC family toxin [Steroidobacteraceae bacterium]|nr:type II toxin-antitoxin system VapC family toxin [Steroidobacteraceae bacterium]
MNVVDSSAWLEYFADGPNAGFFASPIETHADLLIPTVTLFEVFKRIRQQRSEGEALQAVAVMQSGTVVDLDAPLALEAGRLSIEHGLPLADSILLATARAHEATLWTQDADFKSLPGVKFMERRTR